MNDKNNKKLEGNFFYTGLKEKLEKIQFKNPIWWSLVTSLVIFGGTISFNSLISYPEILQKSVWSAKDLSKDFDDFGGLMTKETESKIKSSFVDEDGNLLETWTFNHSDLGDKKDGDIWNKRWVIYFAGSSGVEGGFVKELFDKGYDVATFNPPGYGASSVQPTYQNFTKSANSFVKHFLNKENLISQDVMIYSTSLGTVQALNSAKIYEFFRVVLVNPIDNLWNRCWKNSEKMYNGLACFSVQTALEFNNTEMAKNILAGNKIVQITSSADEQISKEDQYNLFYSFSAKSTNKTLFTVSGNHTQTKKDEREAIFNYLLKMDSQN